MGKADARASLGGDIIRGVAGSPAFQTAVVGGLTGLIEKLLGKLFGQGRHVSVPAADRPTVDDLPDDKIVPPVGKPVPSAPSPKDLGYTSLRLGINKAQYNRELFPDMYDKDKGGNEFGLYRPANQDVYNRWSKIWFDATPFKGMHAVQTTEGDKDGILWTPVFHLFYRGAETIVKADSHLRQDTVNGANRPVQVVEGDSVGVGFSAWDFANGYLCQIQVGDNEGDYEAYVEIPQLGLVSDRIKFRVS